jgi:biopolymer transport protein ExbD
MMRPQPLREFAPNLAPMVDVIMVLLVFFLLGASLNLIRQGVLQTELDPRSGPGAGAAVQIIPSVRIGLEDAGPEQPPRIYLMDRPLESPEALRRELSRRLDAGADPENIVAIAPQGSVSWRYVIKTMDAVIQAGFRNVQFAVSLPPTGENP